MTRSGLFRPFSGLFGPLCGLFGPLSGSMGGPSRPFRGSMGSSSRSFCGPMGGSSGRSEVIVLIRFYSKLRQTCLRCYGPWTSLPFTSCLSFSFTSLFPSLSSSSVSFSVLILNFNYWEN